MSRPPALCEVCAAELIACRPDRFDCPRCHAVYLGERNSEWRRLPYTMSNDRWAAAARKRDQTEQEHAVAAGKSTLCGLTENQVMVMRHLWRPDHPKACAECVTEAETIDQRWPAEARP